MIHDMRLKIGPALFFTIIQLCNIFCITINIYAEKGVGI